MLHLQAKCFFSRGGITRIISNKGYLSVCLYRSDTDVSGEWRLIYYVQWGEIDWRILIYGRLLFHCYILDRSGSSKLFVIQKRKKSIYQTVDKQDAYHYHSGNKPSREETIGQLLKEAAEKWPDHECIVSHHQKVRLTYSDVLLRADKLAAGLKKLGLKKGDRIGIFGPNDVEWFITFLSATRLGLITTAINSAYQRDELIHCLQKVGAKAIVMPAEFKTQNYPKMALSAKEFCPDLEHIVVWSKDHVTYV